MKESLLREVEELDKKYFGARSITQLVSALDAQVCSMKKEPTTANVRKQLGDILFVVTSISRNRHWELDELLEEVIVKLKNRKADRHYYEAHITIEPVFDARYAEFSKLCTKYKFRAATLLMQKRKTETPVRSTNDAFCTGRGLSRSDLEDRMVGLVSALTKAGFHVWRYKTESTLLDSRYDDTLFPLERQKLPDKERTPRAPAEGALGGRKEFLK